MGATRNRRMGGEIQPPRGTKGEAGHRRRKVQKRGNAKPPHSVGSQRLGVARGRGARNSENPNTMCAAAGHIFSSFKLGPRGSGAHQHRKAKNRRKRETAAWVTNAEVGRARDHREGNSATLGGDELDNAKQRE